MAATSASPFICSVQAVTRVNAEQASKISMRMPTRPPIMDHAVPEDTETVAASLHARPNESARLASRAGVKRLVLSHLMPRSERQLEKVWR